MIHADQSTIKTNQISCWNRALIGVNRAAYFTMSSTLTIDVSDLDGTEAFGRRLGEMLFPGALVALVGPLGAGKTHLTRAITEGLHISNPAAVTSPTFVLIQEYSGPVPVYHFDTYRLSGPREFADLGVEEYFTGDGVCIIEWADKVADILPADHLRVEITPIGPTARRFQMIATGPRHRELLRKLPDMLPQPGRPPAE